MHHAKRLHNWDLAGDVISILLNVNRNPRRRRRPFSKAECVPRDLAREFRAPTGVRLTRSALHAMKPFFTKDV